MIERIHSGIYSDEVGLRCFVTELLGSMLLVSKNKEKNCEVLKTMGDSALRSFYMDYSCSREILHRFNQHANICTSLNIDTKSNTHGLMKEYFCEIYDVNKNTSWTIGTAISYIKIVMDVLREYYDDMTVKNSKEDFSLAVYSLVSAFTNALISYPNDDSYRRLCDKVVDDLIIDRVKENVYLKIRCDQYICIKCFNGKLDQYVFHLFRSVWSDVDNFNEKLMIAKENTTWKI